MSTHIPRKRFGQNFLHDHGVIAQIVAAIAPRKDDFVVEIGPGLAALTRPLLANLPRLTVIEIDRDIVRRLRQNFSAEQLCIVEGDALHFDFASLLPEQPAQGGTKLRLVGNLPYNISTPLLFHLAHFAPLVADLHFMLQKEVVERIVAAPRSSDYGRLSVMLQYRFEVDWLFDVPPESFDPMPKVNSAVLRLLPKPQAALAAHDDAVLARLVSAAFAQRRKMLRNTLKDFFDETALAALGISATARAEELSVADYVRLANAWVSR